MSLKIYNLLEIFLSHDYSQFRNLYKSETVFLARKINYVSIMLDGFYIHSVEPLLISSTEEFEEAQPHASLEIDIKDRIFVCEVWGHSSEWVVSEMNSLKEVKALIESSQDNMFLTSQIVFCNNEILEYDVNSKEFWKGNSEMKNNRWSSDQNENIILEEHGEDYFCFVDREVDYAYTFHKNQIDEIIEFLEKIK